MARTTKTKAGGRVKPLPERREAREPPARRMEKRRKRIRQDVKEAPAYGDL